MIMGRRGRREDKCGVKKGPWSPEEDKTLVDYIKEHGHGSWRDIPKLAGLNRCEKSCRLRWTNYLRPNIKRGRFSDQEQQIIINLHALLGNKWSTIASHLPGRTDNDIKNLWNTHLRRKLVEKGLDPITHDPIRSASASSSEQCDLVSLLQQLLGAANIVSGLITNTWDAPNALRLNSSLDTNNNNATVQQQLAKLQMLQNMLNQVLSSNNSSSNPAPNNNNPLYEALGFNNNNDDGSTDALFPCCATQNQTSFQNFERTGEYPTPPNCSSIIMKDDEQIVVLDATTNNNNNNNSGPTNTVIIPFNLFPKLVSASSPQCSNAANNNIGISNNNNNNNPCSSTPTTFKTWASSDFMYEEARDQASYYWKEIMDQDSNQP